MSLRDATECAEQIGRQLRRAIPRGPGHLLVELGAEDGTTIAGQWFDDRDRAAHVAEGTDRGTGEVRLVGGRLLLQARGSDRRLPALRRLVGRPGAVLVSHRPERRAVVRHPAETRHCDLVDDVRGDRDDLGELFSKVVRPDRLAAVVAGINGARATGLRTPALVGTDPKAGVATTRALPGRTLHAAAAAAVRDPPAARWVEIGTVIGESIADLHRGQVPVGARRHDAEAEIAVSHRWLELAAMHGVLARSDPAIETAMTRAERGLRDAHPTVVVPVHRDLHDKQILLTEDGGVGVLDLDLLAAGDPALDLANLLVHFELRVRQARMSPACASDCAIGVLAGYRRRRAGETLDSDWENLLHRLPGYAWATRARLASVYAFRPPSAAAARLLVTEPSPLFAELLRGL